MTVTNYRRPTELLCNNGQVLYAVHGDGRRAARH